jgi:Domain of unknown function (DUF6265)
MLIRSILICVLVLSLTVLTFAQKSSTSASLDDLGWLSGCWEGRQGEAILEEMWSRPAGGSMLGLARTIKGDRTISYEFMQFRMENGILVFLPQPQGGTRVSFPAKDFFGGKFTFENLQHDFPQRIIYERKGPGLLLAAIEGTLKGNAEREEFQMKKVRCNPKDE